jgi:hypothetical protein
MGTADTWCCLSCLACSSIYNRCPDAKIKGNNKLNAIVVGAGFSMINTGHYFQPGLSTSFWKSQPV